MWASLAITMVFLASSSHAPPASADAACDNPPPDVQSYLRSRPLEKLVHPSDLQSDDQELWKAAHSASCPGWAVADLGHAGKLYAISALRKGAAGHVYQTTLLRCRTGKKMREQVLQKGERVDFRGVVSPKVVWVAMPGEFEDQSSGKKIRIRDDSIVFEKIESISEQFYVSGGRIRRLLAAD